MFNGSVARVAPDPEADAHVRTIEREGFVVLSEVLSGVEVGAMRAALAPYLQGQHMGRNEFEGFRSERVYALLAKDPALALLGRAPSAARDRRSPARTELPAFGVPRDQRPSGRDGAGLAL